MRIRRRTTDKASTAADANSQKARQSEPEATQHAEGALVDAVACLHLSGVTHTFLHLPIDEECSIYAFVTHASCIYAQCSLEVLQAGIPHFT